MTLQERKPMSDATDKTLLLYAMLGTQWMETAKDAIDTMLFAARAEVEEDLKKYVAVDYVPFDPSVKRTESTVHPQGSPGEKFKVTKGAPNVICDLAYNAAELRPTVEELVDSYAERGIRCLGIAYTDSSEQWVFCGMLTFVDPPRPDTKDVIHQAHALGVGVKMITGDHVAIAKETCRVLDLGTTVLANKDIELAGNRLGDLAEHCDGFAGVFPEHKFDIVNALRGNGWLVGMTGDGVNDAPALKRADIGIAVEGATDAARAAADIVLVSPGLSVIIEAIDLARQIFQRMKNYITYRIACTLQLLVFFFLTVLFVAPRQIMQDPSVPQYFALPVMALVLITILNDGTIISIAYDHVVPGSRPEKWNLPTVIAVAVVLGAVACASSVLMLYLCLFSHRGDSLFNRWFGAADLSFLQIRCIIYLKVSISDFLTVFSARTQGFFFERRPGRLLLAAAVFATLVSTLLARYWPFEEMEGITWRWCGITWAYCIIFWLIQDCCKVMMVRSLHEGHAGQDTQMAKKHEVKQIRRSVKVELGKEALGQASLGEGLSKAQVVARIETLEAELRALKVAVAKLA